jgi:hypothetical protein
VYFFANLNEKLTESTVTLRGRHDLEAWDPHTGGIQPVQATYGIRSEADFTRIQLSLPYLKSLFLVSVPVGGPFAFPGFPASFGVEPSVLQSIAVTAGSLGGSDDECVDYGQ